MGLELIKKLKENCWSDVSVVDFEKLISSNFNKLGSIINLSIDNVPNYSWRTACLFSKASIKRMMRDICHTLINLFLDLKEKNHLTRESYLK